MKCTMSFLPVTVKAPEGEVAAAAAEAKPGIRARISILTMHCISSHVDFCRRIRMHLTY